VKFDTAIIFAGGKSSRMGRDKALLPFGGYDTLTEYQYRRLSKIFNRVYISTKNDKFNFNGQFLIHLDWIRLIILSSQFIGNYYSHYLGRFRIVDWRVI